MVAGLRSLEKANGKPQITRENWFVPFYLPLLRRSMQIGG
jgi:hypothetical protein